MAALVVLSSAPALAQYPPAEETLVVSTTAAVPGEPVTISGSGYEPGTTITITFASTPRVVGVVQADASGRFTAQVVVPPDAHPGRHTISATGMGHDGTIRVISAAIMVMTPAVSQSPGAGDVGRGAVHPGAAGPGAPPGNRARAGGSSAPGAVAGAAPIGASGPLAPVAVEPARGRNRLGLTGPVLLPVLVLTALGSVTLGTFLTRVRRRQRS